METTQVSGATVKKVCHPFRCRLPADTTFAKNDPVSLIGTGYFSIALSILTAFRTTPVILLATMFRIRLTGESLDFFPLYGPVLIYSWLALIFLSLAVGGVIMTCSGRIRNRRVLLFQPWALLLLYFDGFFWLAITIYLHVALNSSERYGDGPSINDLPYPVACFTVIYTDIALFFVVHFAFATYYITAQITVIENCF